MSTVVDDGVMGSRYIFMSACIKSYALNMRSFLYAHYTSVGLLKNKSMLANSDLWDKPGLWPAN